MGHPTSISTRRAVRRTTIAVSLGTVIETYDLLLYGYFAFVLADLFFPGSSSTAALLHTFAIYAVGFAARPLGALAFGHVGDRVGRRPALVASIMMMAAATLGIGVLPTYDAIGIWAPLLLLVCRLLQGFSIGGEGVGANIMIFEHAPAERYGRALSVNQIAGFVGLAGAAMASFVLANLLTPAELAAWGWRLPFLAALPLALVGLYLRLRIADSPEFRAGRTWPAFPLAEAVRTAWRGMVVLACWLVVGAVSGYLVLGYMPTYLIRVVGLTPAEAFGTTLALVVVMIVSAVLGGYLIDRYPPWLVATGCATGIAVTAVPGFLLIQHGGLAGAIAGQAIFASFIAATSTVTAVLSLRLFPARVRYTAVALTYQVALTLVGGTAPYVSTMLIARTGNPSAPAWYVVALAPISLAAAVVGLRRAGLTRDGERSSAGRSLSRPAAP
jgi:MHS family proline/betaine transporter-like MFS transporter